MLSLISAASSIISIGAGGGISYEAATTADAIKQWTDPFHFIVYLFVLFVGMVVYYQWKWSRDAKNNVLLEIVKADGHADYELVPLTGGGSVSLTNPKTEKVKQWPINELSTITVPYPGVAFVPEFLQKEIRKIGVTEEDWEPYTNRSPHRKNVVSPDVLIKLTELADFIENPPDGAEVDPKDTVKLTALQEVIKDLEENASTYPTREIIGSPAVLGNLMHERVTEIVTALGAGLMGKIENIVKQLSRLGKPINSMAVYIMLGVCVITGIAGIWFSASSGSVKQADIDKIKNALGIVETPPPTYPITVVPTNLP